MVDLLGVRSREQLKPVDPYVQFYERFKVRLMLALYYFIIVKLVVC